MKVTSENYIDSIAEFKAWSGAVERLDWIIEHDYADYFTQLIIVRILLGNYWKMMMTICTGVSQLKKKRKGKI